MNKDYLSVLRDYILSEKEIIHDEKTNEFIFNEEKVPEDTPTSWIPAKGDPYSLKQIWFLYQNREKKHPIYLVLSTKAKIRAIAMPDRRPLLDYLRGEISTHTNLVPMEIKPTVAAPPEAIEAPVEPEADEEHTEPAQKRRRVAEAEGLALIASKERMLSTRTSLLQNKKTNFASLGLVVQKLKKEEQVERTQRHDSRHSKRSRKNSKDNIPIIIVPSSRTSPLNIYNARALLEGGVFMTYDEARKKAPISTDQANRGITFHRTKQRGATEPVMVPYVIVHNTRGFSSRDWDRVIAVFCSGKVWQFKDWKWSDPVELFEHVLGCHVRYENEVADQNIAKWNVNVFTVNQSRRHLDSQVLFKFWQAIDSFASRVKPHLNT